MDTEHRKNPRAQVDVCCELLLGNKAFTALILNVSLGGCLIETSARPRMREIVALRVRLGMSIEEIKLKVVWQSYGQRLGKIGTQFYGMEDGEIYAKVAGILGASPRNIGSGEKDESK